MLEWLLGVRARHVTGNIYEIDISGYGPADVGPYDELLRHVGLGSGLECHHIVGREHLRLAAGRFTEWTAPAVAIPRSMHRMLMSPRFTAEVGVLGGRYGGRTEVGKQELLELYREVYTWHTPFRELYAIAARVLG